MTDRYLLLEGDALEKLKGLADNSVDSIVTDSPYGLSKEPDMMKVLEAWMKGEEYVHAHKGFMNAEWDSFVPSPMLWRECYRVLKHGGYLLSFFGTRTQDIGTLAIRMAGFEIRDTITYLRSGEDEIDQFLQSLTEEQRDAFARVMEAGHGKASFAYGTGFPKSMDVSKAIDKKAGAERASTGKVVRGGNRAARGGAELVGSEPTESEKWKDVTVASTEAAKQWEGWGTALKPAIEPITVARKPLAEGTVAENVLKHGTGGINIDACRIGDDEIVTDGSAKRNGDIYSSFAGIEPQSHKGRFPANLITDGSEAVKALFPEQTSGGMTKHYEYQNNGNSMGAPSGSTKSIHEANSGSASRFFYVAKPDATDRNEGLDGMEAQKMDEGRKEGKVGGDNPRNRGVLPRLNFHPTVKGTQLMRYLVRLVTPVGGVCLDPFTGSGSTGKACMWEGIYFIGIDKDPKNIPLAHARIQFAINNAPPEIDRGGADEMPANQLRLFE